MVTKFINTHMTLLNNPRTFSDLLPKGYGEKIQLFLQNLRNIKSHINMKDIKIYFKKHNTSFNQLAILFLLFSALFLSLLAYKLNESYNSVNRERIKKWDQANYWQKVTQDHPNFPDAYYQAAWYFNSLGYRQKAYTLLEKALEIDPHFSEARQLEERILKE